MKKNFIEAGKRLVNYLENYKIAGEESQMDEEAIEILFKYLKGYPQVKIKGTDLDPYSVADSVQLKQFMHTIKTFIR